MSFQVGSRVETEKGRGVVGYCGTTEFAEGIWVGVQLDEPNGKNNGTVKGVKYFECADNYGVFVRASQARLENRGKAVTTGIRLPSNLRKEGVKMRASPGASPHITPSPSVEKLKSSGSAQPLLMLGVRKHSVNSKQGIPKTTSNETPKVFASKLKKSRSGQQIHSTFGRKTGVLNSAQIEELQQDKIITPKSSEAFLSSHSEANAGSKTPENVKSMVKKLEEAPMSSPTLIPPGMDESNELEWLRIQYKDLSEKLESLRFKRKEDHVKLVEFERNRIQLQALLEFKSRMIEDHTRLQRKIQEKEKELREAIDQKKEDREDLSEIEERLELITVEKEMAEEKVEILQGEFEVEKQRTQDLEMQLELLRSEMEKTDEHGLQGNSVQMKQLEQQNEMLREAVVKMRDMMGQVAAEKQEAMLENEKIRSELASLVKLCEKMKDEAIISEQNTIELKEQVDAAIGSEKMIETLTEKNLDLEEKLRNLEETIEDFEAIRTMDEEILETQKEAEKELRHELDMAQSRHNELLVQLKSCGTQSEEYEKTILRFRKRVGDLNEEIQQHKDQILRLEDQIKQLQDGISVPALGGFNLISAARTFAEVVEGEVRCLELEYSHQLIKYLKAFLPDNFTKIGGDNDAVALSVLFPRVSQKAALFAKLLNQKYPPVPGGMRREHVTKSHTSEQWAHCAKFTYLLNSFSCITRKFGSALQQCSVERLSRLAQLQMDMAAQERMIDHYIDLLRTNRLDENSLTDNLEKGINYFKNVFSVHMVGEAYDTNQALSDHIAQFLAGIFWIKINIQRIMFIRTGTNDESEIQRFTNQLMAMITECEQLSIRSKNRIPTQKLLLIGPDLDEKISHSAHCFDKAAAIIDSVCAIASIQLSTLPDADGLEDDRLKDMLQGAVEKVHGTVDSSKAQQQILISIETIRNFLNDLANDLDKGTMEADYPEKKPFPPLLERAHVRKQDAAEAEGLRWQLEKKDSEIVDLKKTLRSRADVISNYRLRLEMADKKIVTSGKADESRLTILQSKCEELQNELKKRRAEYEETMDTLQKDLETLEKENTELKDRLKNMSKKALLMNLSSTIGQTVISSPPTPTNSSSFSTYAAEIALLEAELVDKHNALKAAHQRIRQLKSHEMMHLLSKSESVNVPLLNIAGPLSLEAAQGSYKDELAKMMREAESILSDSRKYQVPFIIDFTKPKNVRMQEEHEYHMKIKDINRRIDNMKTRIRRIWNKYEPGKPLPNLFKNIKHVASPNDQADNVVADDKGIHSIHYKNAYEKLFVDLEAEREKFEKKRASAISRT